MKDFLKKKAAKALLAIAPHLGIIIAVLILAAIGLNFFSGLRLLTEYENKDYASITQSPEVEFLNSIRNDEWSQEEYYGNYAFTKEDMQKIFEAVIKNNGDVDKVEQTTGMISSQNKRGVYQATKVYYQYYWETWCVYSYDLASEGTDPATGEPTVTYSTVQTPLDSELSEEDILAEHPEATNFQWGWHSGFRPKDSELSNHPESTLYNSDDENHPYVTLDNKPKNEGDRDWQYTDELHPRYKTAWQPVYALCQMSASANVQNWAERPDEGNGIVIEHRLDEDVLNKIIDIFTFEAVWGYEGAWDSKKSGYAQKLVDDPDFGAHNVTDYTKWDDNKTGTKDYKWDELDKISYTIERVGDWDKEENGTEVYKRRLYKIPATSLLGVSNGYMSWSYYGKEVVKSEGEPPVYATKAEGAGAINDEAKPDAVVQGTRQKYGFYEKFVSDDGNGYESARYDHTLCAYDAGPGPKKTNLTDEHVSGCPKYTCGGNQHAYVIDGGIYECDAQALEAEFIKVVGYDDWDWDKFLNILMTLPDPTNGEVLATFEEIRDACKEAELSGNSAHIIRPLEPNETIIDRNIFEGSGESKKIFMGKGDEKSISKLAGGKMLIPDIYEDWDESAAVDGTLRENLNLSVEQIQKVFTSLPGYLSHPTSLITTSPYVAEALVQFQNDSASMGKPVDVLGLLAIANCESAYGTSDICRRKYNFIGWGAVDWNPGGGAWTFNNSGVSAALVKNFELIRDNYIYGHYNQDTYYKMRYNNGVHQYCTSTTWPSTNAVIRQQMRKLLGIETDERKANPTLTDEQNEKLKEYVGTYISEGSLTPPCDSRRITSHFGYRNTGIKGASTFHRGVDIGASTPGVQGDLIRSAMTGYVSHIGWISGGGYAVYITGGGKNESGGDGQQIVTKYMHLQTNSTQGYIQVGDIVEAGQPIGHMGNTGVSSGPHLHFALEVNGEAVDPLPWLYGSWHDG